MYLSFLLETAETVPCKHFQIDFTAQKLLEIIACCAYYEPLTVTEAMELREIGSPATVHRKLDDLLIAGLIEHQYEGDNRRTKFLVLTPKSINYFNSLSDSMAAVSKERATS